MRIVSLLPSATETVCLLGLDDQLVGVSADSDWPPNVVQRLPVLNTVSIDPRLLSSREIDRVANEGHRGASLYHVDTELLRKLPPDLILTQEVCEVCAVSRNDVDVATRALGYQPEALARYEEIRKERSSAVVRRLSARLEAVRQRTTDLPRPRVFCMEWLDPPYTAGHWVPEMVELAGGRDDLGTPAGSSRRIDWQDVLDYAPEVIVLMPCSLELERVAQEFDLLRTRPAWHTLPAVRSGRVYAGNTHLFSRSGPRLVDGTEVLGRVLHPEIFEMPLPRGYALKVSQAGDRLEPYR